MHPRTSQFIYNHSNIEFIIYNNYNIVSSGKCEQISKMLCYSIKSSFPLNHHTKNPLLRVGDRMKKTSILLPGLLLAASLFAWLQSGQVHLFANQGEWPVLLMLLGAVLLYQGKKEAAGPHVLIGLLLFGIGLHFFAKPELSWWPGDFEMILFVFGFSLFAAARKEYVYEAAAMIGFSLFLYFFKQITTWLESVHIPTEHFKTYWPYVFIGISLLLLFIKRNKTIR